MDNPQLMTCPRCGTEGHFQRADIEDTNSGAILLLGGVLAYLLSRSSNQDMYICSSCHYVFKPAPHINKWVTLFIAILAFVTAFAGLINYIFAH